VLNDPSRLLFIGEVGSTPVGVIRLDRLSAECAEVSLFLDPQLHGLGLGTHLLRAGEPHASRLGTTRLLATVLPGNESSRRLFASAGYRFSAQEGSKSLSPSPVRNAS
jgi:RimJ/RimL family protein N-acetyltransferase